MPRADDSKVQLSLSQGSDDTAFMTAVAQQVQTTLQKKKKETEAKLLQTIESELERCAASRCEEFTDIVEEMEVIYQQFVMDYAKAEDNIRAKWQQLLIASEKCLVFSKEQQTLALDADMAREKGQVKGMAISKKAVEDCGALIASLTDSQAE